MINIKKNGAQLDQEWMVLIQTAKKIGLNPEDVRAFLAEEREGTLNDDEKS
ncbi:anti-repressor SinI family protein [Oceanobacillus massiliensis]|uniref:anti-repressor SinI family protein n=1 Tax=Oceanobacillus massiliensis TaxID=1465765 RepID=UPI0002897BBE|nr:anti-repressor SinI family protein [Oceanobacillus massiliensis]